MFLRREHRDRPAMNRPAWSRRGTRPGLTTPEGRDRLATYTVTRTADSGPGSPRDEIGLAESDSTHDTITFNSTFNTPRAIQHPAPLGTVRRQSQLRPAI
jgi:hypothetical protein